ncbi:hypothetical protein OHA21_17295 [Actinoplanes sp. NBC_00393]|uniref:hypothetical protein n=1 Tax=Actinoplanes sp. NBC_00393 TaxID=2975953 RepID=UPI002E2283AD
MRRATRAILGSAVLGGFALLSAGQAVAAPATPPAAPAAAAAAAQYGFAFADQPSNPSYVANERMSANSTGGTNTVTRYRTGDYEVRMPGLGATQGGNVQVSAYGEHGNRCKTTYWLPLDGAMAIGVACHNPSGVTADTPFTVQFQRGSNDPNQQSAYLLAHPPVSGAPDARYSYNSGGAPNTVAKTGTGSWSVDFGSGFTKLGGVVHVTAYGNSANFCKVRSWNVRTADVRCFAAGGQPVDTAWSLRYTDRHLPNGFADLGGYVWANQPAAALGKPYSPDARHSFNMQGGETNTVTHEGTGAYRVRLNRIPAFDQGSPVATAHGSSTAICSVTELFSSGSSSAIDVDCQTPAGAPVDSAFTLSHATNR